MTSKQLMDSITSKGEFLKTFDLDGKLIYQEKSGWMSKKQSDFLISLLNVEDYMHYGNKEFWYENIKIHRTAPNGARTWKICQRFDY